MNSGLRFTPWNKHVLSKPFPTARLHAQRTWHTQRTVSTVAATPARPRRFRRAKVAAYSALLAAILGVSYIYATDTRAAAHQYLVPPLVRWLYPDAEDAHHAGVEWLQTLYRYGLHPRERGNPDGKGELLTEVFGYNLCNPIGISAGLDKDSDIPSALFALGPAIVEVGGITPLPQDGNPRPRAFRLPSQQALINRYGLNSAGAEAVATNLQERVEAFAYVHGFPSAQAVLNGAAGVPPGSLIPGKLLAVQVAKNRDTPNADTAATRADYVACVDRLGAYADLLVVNVSSPNTAGLRDLQAAAPLSSILAGVVEAARRVPRRTKPFVLVKVSPDEDTPEQVAGICAAVWAAGVDGVIVGNTTRRRLGAAVVPKHERSTLDETGGFSGPGMAKNTVALVRRYRTLLDQPQIEGESSGSGYELADTRGSLELPDATKNGHRRKVIFASGGITDGETAVAALDAGASVVMTYTGLVYGGSGTVTRMKEELRELKSKT